MERHASPESLPSLGADVPDAEGWAVLPAHRDLYYGGAWHRPLAGNFFALVSPGTGQSLGHAADASADDVDAAVRSAHEAFSLWRDVPPLERAKSLRAFAAVVRANARELALLDAIDCGNPVRAMVADAEIAASQIDFFAGLVTEMKGSSIPMGPDRMNVTVREPLGVVARIIPFNHPFMFAAGKAAAPLAAGNTVVVKPPEQAPLSALRLAELVADLFPPGVFNVITGSGRETGAALVAHRSVAKVALIGSVAAGRAVMRSASDTIKPVLLELGGKNALIAFPDADPAAVADAMIAGMNFAWCGQSCGSTSRAFVHAAIHDRVLQEVRARIGAFQPGRPEDWNTTMGAIINRAQYDRVLAYIASARQEGATLVCGGVASECGPPCGRPLHRADRFRRCAARHDDRARGNLRARAFRVEVAGRGGDDSAMSTRSTSVSPARSGPTISMRRCARRTRRRPVTCGSTK